MLSGDGEGADAEVFNPSIIVRAVLSEESNGVNLHPIQVEHTYEFLSELVAGIKDAENTQEAMPTGTVEWMSTFKEAWEQASSKAWPSFVRVRCEVWSGAAVAVRSRPTSPGMGGVVAGSGSKRAVPTIFGNPTNEDERIAELMHGLVVSDHDVPKAIEDIKAQRISGVRIMALSLALVSGRVHPNGESSDLRFGSDLRLCPSVRQQRKAGVSTFEDVLKTKNRRELSLHYTRLAKEYNDRQLIEEATLISQFWSETTSAFEGDDAGLFSYLAEWHRRYNGRGIPKLLDTDLILRTRKSESGGASSSELKELKDALKTANGKLNSAEQKNDAILKRVTRLESTKGGGPSSDRACFICGGDHLAKVCPQRKDDKPDKPAKGKFGRDRGVVIKEEKKEESD